MKIKRIFVTGLVILLPLTLTYWILTFLIDLFTQPFVGVVSTLLSTFGFDHLHFLWLDSNWTLELLSQMLILVSLFFAILAIGAVGRHFIFKYLIWLGDSIIHRIPVISTVYKTSQEVINTIFTSSTRSFKQVVMVPFPNPKAQSIGLVTRENLPEFQGTSMNDRICVFVPTTPNPTSGFLMLFERKEVTYLDMTVEEALRYIISCGIIQAPIRPLNDNLKEKMPLPLQDE